MTARKGNGTQRAYTVEFTDGTVGLDMEEEPIGSCRTPVLVIPEADVKGCIHRAAWMAKAPNCEKCGSFRRKRHLSDGGFEWSRWQRPRVLRARKEVKR